MGLKGKIINLLHQNTKGLYFGAILKHFTDTDCFSSDVREAIWSLIEEQKLSIDYNNVVTIRPDAKIRITRDNFNAEKVLELIANGKIDYSEAVRLLEEACHAYANVFIDFNNLKNNLITTVENFRQNNPIDD